MCPPCRSTWETAKPRGGATASTASNTCGGGQERVRGRQWAIGGKPEGSREGATPPPPPPPCPPPSLAGRRGAPPCQALPRLATRRGRPPAGNHTVLPRPPR